MRKLSPFAAGYISGGIVATVLDMWHPYSSWTAAFIGLGIMIAIVVVTEVLITGDKK